jgi:uncharacterized membrane protein YidH (DUF202 family)
MNRTSGIGLTGFGFVLVIVGAIMRFGITVHTSGFNIHKIGDILLLVGIILVIVSLALTFMGNRSRVTTRTEYEDLPPQRERLQPPPPGTTRQTTERSDWNGGPY